MIPWEVTALAEAMMLAASTEDPAPVHLRDPDNAIRFATAVYEALRSSGRDIVEASHAPAP